MNILWVVCSLAVGYLLGCVNMAALIAEQRGFDIRKQGSGNAGASNALVTMGKTAAVCTGFVDISKAFIPVWLIRHLSIGGKFSWLAAAVGIAVILGHIFPFWMRFRGGKGFASFLGMLLAWDWRCFLVCLAATVCIVLILRYIAIATLTAAFLTPAFGFWQHTVPEGILLLCLAALILWKHIPNIRRIANKTEIRFGDHSHRVSEHQ